MSPDSGSRIIDATKGTAHEFHERAPFTWLKNDKRVNDYLLINIKAWKAVAGLCIAAGAILGTLHTTMVYVYEPRLRQTIQEQIRPLSLELATERAVMQEHLLDEARKQGDSVRRAELDAKLERIESKLDALYRAAR